MTEDSRELAGVHTVPYFRMAHVWLIGAWAGLTSIIISALLGMIHDGFGYSFYLLFPALFWVALTMVKKLRVRACATCDHFIGKRDTVCGGCGADLAVAKS
ncbi:MAG: hypothetical protein JWP10_1242 [Nocardioidaceae bacterium]|nr:hypothetical protein [Nocardioidaceae bacterium]